MAERDLDRLFWDDDLRSSDPGTRSKLYIRHALPMYLYHKKEANTEASLGTFFGIDQGTASRYLRVASGVLAEILPTARNYTAMIKKIYEWRDGADTDDGANAGPRTPGPERPGPLSVSGPPPPVAATEEPPAPAVIGAPTGGKGKPGKLAGPVLEMPTSGQLSTRVATITDGTHTPTERYSNPDWNKATFSGKKKMHTLNTNITISPDGTIINISKTVPGSTNDLTLLRESPPDFGALSKAAADPETPEEKRPVNIYDRGYQGIRKDTPGAETWIGTKRNAGSDPDTGGLTQRDLDHNAEVTRARITVEHAIGRIKQYRITTRPTTAPPISSTTNSTWSPG